MRISKISQGSSKVVTFVEGWHHLPSTVPALGKNNAITFGRQFEVVVLVEVMVRWLKMFSWYLGYLKKCMSSALQSRSSEAGVGCARLCDSSPVLSLQAPMIHSRRVFLW